jgi:hypothetical protein
MLARTNIGICLEISLWCLCALLHCEPMYWMSFLYEMMIQWDRTWDLLCGAISFRSSEWGAASWWHRFEVFSVELGLLAIPPWASFVTEICHMR